MSVTMLPQKVAVIGSNKYRNLDNIAAVLAQLPDGTRVITGNIGKVNQKVQELVSRDPRLQLQVIPADLRGIQENNLAEIKRRVDRANSQAIQACERMIVFKADSESTAHFIAAEAAFAGKTVKTIDDKPWQELPPF